MKDANDILIEWKTNGLGAEEMRERIDALKGAATPVIVRRAEMIGTEETGLRGEERRRAIEEIAALAGTLSQFDLAYYEVPIAKAMGFRLQEFRRLVKAQRGETEKAAEPEKASGEAIRTAGGWIDGHLVELFYNPKKGLYFAVRYPDGHIVRETKEVVINGRRYAPPLLNSIITKRIVRLPSEMGELLSERELIAICRAHARKYFDFGSNVLFEMLSGLYPLFSHLYDGFMETVYLRGLGDYGTGKTRLIKSVGYMCYRPTYISGGSSPASIYRLLDFWRGTLVLNEGDFSNSDEASIIAKILNGGTERYEGITRVKKSPDGSMDIEAFNVFGPKVIATRKEFNDRAIASRCLTMDMVPFTPRPEIPQSLPSAFEAEALEIRNLLITYRMHHAQEDYVVDQNAGDRSLEPRLNQVTLSLMTIIKDEEARESIRAFLRDYNERTRNERYGTVTARVLEGLVRAWAWGPVSEHPSDKNRVYLKDIALAANQIMDEQKRKMGDDGGDDAKKMTSKGISHTMKKFLQLRSERATDGPNTAYRGTYAVDMAQEESRVRALCARWGVVWLERGSLKRGTGTPIDAPGLGEQKAAAWEQLGGLHE